jgi:GDP-mannose transporter
MKPMEISDGRTKTSIVDIQAIVSSAAYATCSVSMVLINKFVALSVEEKYRSSIPNIAVIWLQCAVAVLILFILRTFELVEFPAIQWSVVKQWLPINIIFVLMLSTGFLSFIYLSVPMINIMKNLTNVITVGGDYFLYNEA